MISEKTLPHHKSYVLTFDMSHKVQSFKRIGLKVPAISDPYFIDFKVGFEEKFAAAVPCCNLITYDMIDLADEIIAKTSDINGTLDKSFIVSTCSEIAFPEHGCTLEANRIIDPNTGKILGIGPRPGFLDLSDQIRGIINLSGNKPIVMIEDGSFTGSTLLELARIFEKNGKKVSAIVVGVVFPKAYEELTKNFHGDFSYIYKLEKNTIDWMPDHDFCPLTPNNGRTVGAKFGSNPLPLFTHDGRFFTVPYIEGFPKSLDDWSSIKQSKQSWEFSVYCLMQTAKLFKIIGQLNNVEITFDHLFKIRPLVGIPYSIGCRIPEISKKQNVVDYLSTIAHELG